MNEQIKVPKIFIDLLDQVFEIERKTESLTETNSISRNINRFKEIFEQANNDWGLIYHNPIGEPYNETRTDIEASISGNSADNLFITEVIKPIIRYKSGGITLIARKGIVVVESKSKL
jgi:hypothetical protein